MLTARIDCIDISLKHVYFWWKNKHIFGMCRLHRYVFDISIRIVTLVNRDVSLLNGTQLAGFCLGVELHTGLLQNPAFQLFMVQAQQV